MAADASTFAENAERSITRDRNGTRTGLTTTTTTTTDQLITHSAEDVISKPEWSR